MDQLLTIGLKGLIGGSVVVVFAAIGEVLRPRGVAGITSAAPSIAIASLGVTVVATGATVAADQSLGMVAGACALVVWCLCGLDSVKRFGAVKGSILATAAWAVVAIGLWDVAIR
jgi:hypothetical protein